MLIEPLLKGIFPLKDKGETAKKIKRLDHQRNHTVEQMELLSQKFKKTFRPPWPIHLSVHRVARGNVYLRWRGPGVNGQGQPYIDLFGSDIGEKILQRHTQRVRNIFWEFESQRIELNVIHSVATGCWQRIRKYEEELTNLHRDNADAA